MKSYDYYAAIFKGSIFCIECLPNGVTENDGEVRPIFASDEWDHSVTCEKCGEEHEYMNIIEE